MQNVIVIGAGIIGTAIAWRCAQRGHLVTVIDPDSFRGAWHTAAGMLAPVTELDYTETPLLRLGLASLSRWPAFAAELTDLTGLPTGLRESGTVAVAWDAADLAALRDLDTFARGLGVTSELLTGRELRSLEPALAAGLPGGWHAPHDHQVDPRLAHEALRIAARRVGVTFLTDEVVSLRRQGGRVVGVELGGGTTRTADTVVLAAGAWSSLISDVAVRPVKGQTLRLSLPGPPRLHRVLRGRVRGHPIYLLPRQDGRIVVGASSEEAGYDVSPRAGAIYDLLRDAQALLPELEEASFEEVATGLRPGTPDNAPLLGRAEPGLVVATGHHRNGVLLAPLTADAITELVTDDVTPAEIASFAPDRFAAVPA